MAATTMVSILFYQYTRLQGTIIPFFVFLSIAHSTSFLSSSINGKFRSSFYSFYFFIVFVCFSSRFLFICIRMELLFMLHTPFRSCEGGREVNQRLMSNKTRRISHPKNNKNSNHRTQRHRIPMKTPSNR